MNQVSSFEKKLDIFVSRLEYHFSRFLEELLGRLRLTIFGNPQCSDRTHEDDWLLMGYHCPTCFKWVCGWCGGGAPSELCDDCVSDLGSHSSLK